MPPRRVRVTIPETAPQLPEATLPKVADYEEWVVRHASHYTVSQKWGVGSYRTTTHLSLEAAIAVRAGNPRAIIYAVAPSGRFVPLGPNQYAQFLAIEKEKR